MGVFEKNVHFDHQDGDNYTLKKGEMLRRSHIGVLSQQNRRQWNIQLLSWGGKANFLY